MPTQSPDLTLISADTIFSIVLSNRILLFRSFSMSSNQFIGGICCYILGCFLASAGGIGGGGVLVSIGLVVFDWGYTRSVVLALVAVFGNFRCFPNKRTKKRKNEQKNRAKQRKKQKQT